jgi:hypothetical protein
LERHYQQVKAAAADPDHPAHQTIVRLNNQASRSPSRRTRFRPKSKTRPKGKQKGKKRKKR